MMQKSTVEEMREELMSCREENEKLREVINLLNQQKTNLQKEVETLREQLMGREDYGNKRIKNLKEVIRQKKVKINLAIDKYEKYKAKNKGMEARLQLCTCQCQQQLNHPLHVRTTREGSSTLEPTNAGRLKQQKPQKPSAAIPPAETPQLIAIEHDAAGILEPEVDILSGFRVVGDYDEQIMNSKSKRQKKKSKKKRKRKRSKKMPEWKDPFEEILRTNKWKQKKGEEPWEVRLENSEFTKQAKKVGHLKQKEHAVEASGEIITSKEVSVRPWGIYRTGQAEIDRAQAEKRRIEEESEIEQERREIGW